MPRRVLKAMTLSTVLKCAPHDDGCSLLLRVRASLTLHGEGPTARKLAVDFGGVSGGPANGTSQRGGEEAPHTRGLMSPPPIREPSGPGGLLHEPGHPGNTLSQCAGPQGLPPTAGGTPGKARA